MVVPANRLRHIKCEIPDNLINSLIAFEDDFDAQIKWFYDRLDYLIDTELPDIEAEVKTQIAIRKELLQGSPVANFNSMANIEQYLKLTNPERDPITPETRLTPPSPESRRIDEKKLGAYGISCLKGKLFKIIKGRRIEPFRRLWRLSGNSFYNFKNLADTILNPVFPVGDFLFLMNNSAKTNDSPWISWGFNDVYEITGYQPSLFKTGVFFNKQINQSAANRKKLNAYGFTETQITNIFAGQSPNVDVDLKAKFRQVISYLGTLAKVLILPKTDPLRNPRWRSESDWIERVLKEYFEYRLLKNMTSHVLDPDFYSLLMQNLTPEELKELFEERPDILDFELPQKLDEITDLVTRALSVPAGTSIINTYMLQIPDEKYMKEFECRLFEISLSLWKVFAKQLPERAKTLERLIQELTGNKTPLSENTPRCLPDSKITIDDILKALGAEGESPGPLNDLFNTIVTTDDPTDKILIEDVIAATSSGETAATQEEQSEKASESKSPGEPPGSGGKRVARTSVETAAMLLARLTNWNSNFTGCGSIQSVGTEPVAGRQEVVDSRTGQVLASTTNSADDIVNKDLRTVVVSVVSQPYTTIMTSPPQFVPAPGSVLVFDGQEQQGSMSEPVYQVTIKGAHPIREGQSIQVVAAPTKKLIKKFYPKVVDNNTLVVEVSGSPAPGDDFLNYEYLPRIDEKNYSAEKRREINSVQGKPAKVNFSLELELNNCKSRGAIGALSKWLEAKRKFLERWLEQIIDVIREVLVTVMDKIDAWILKIQLIIDKVLAFLERLLTLDINLSGQGGYENSLMKCIFSVDLTLKIDLLGFLLGKLEDIFPKIGLPIFKFLDLLRDFMLNIYCIPINYINELLKSADPALKSLSEMTNGLIACSVKDPKLPDPIIELLHLINGIFSLRALVLRQGTSDWKSMSFKFRSERDNFTGLSQFASVCTRPTMAELQAKMTALAERNTSSLPIKENAIQYQSSQRAVATAAESSATA